MRFLKVVGAFTKWGLIGILVNDWAALYLRGLILEGDLYMELYSTSRINIGMHYKVHLIVEETDYFIYLFIILFLLLEETE